MALMTLALASSTGTNCGEDIALAASHVAASAASIFLATTDCLSNKIKCVADIQSTAASLSKATDDVTQAVSDCGGNMTKVCRAAVDAIAGSLANATAVISDAVVDCGGSPAKPFKCATDVGAAVKDVASVTSDVGAAVHACK